MAFLKNNGGLARVGIGLAILGICLAIGLVLTGLWPQTPLYAVATDRVETYGMATGPLDSDVEAVYFLDYLTGQLTAVVLGKQQGTCTGVFQANVAVDLKLDKQTNPKFLMTTGIVNLRRSGGTRLQPASSVCYVAEVTSGKVAAYNIHWSPTMYASNQPQGGPLFLIGVTQFRQGLGPGPGGSGQ
jgi:hypothetical protein